MHPERIKQIDSYKSVKSVFIDFARFEGEKNYRASERDAFMTGVNYTPTYDYEKLDSLLDDDALKNKKMAIYEAVLELEAAKAEPDADEFELEIYAAYHELRLNKILLVEAAQKVNSATTAAERATAINGYALLNEKVYGTFDIPTYLGMLSTEVRTAAQFKPRTERAQQVQSSLKELIGHKGMDVQPEQELLSQEMLMKLCEVILQRYAHVLRVIPDTDDSIYYDAVECARIMEEALDAGGLKEKGWSAVVNPKKSNPTTNTADRIIALPASTRRNASELRRLIIHEQECHARRGENGHETGFQPLKNGTADYADVEEGLGVLLECALAGSWDNPSFNRARDRYITAGLAFGADGAPRDARQVYETLWRIFAVRLSENGDISEEAITSAQHQAYTHVDNAFRGTAFWMQGVIYTKLKVYYEGLRKNAQFIEEYENDIEGALDTAMIGKHDHTNPSERSDIQALLSKC